MIITSNRLAKYKSKKQCNLDMFKWESFGHREKKWKSKDGKEHLICEMETMHLWHTFNMLNKIIETCEWAEYASGPDPDTMAFDCFMREMNQAMAMAEESRVALQYIGHELYKREASVPKLPDKEFKKKLNRANNLHHGFADIDGKITFKDDW
jgi:hypothetical protein